MAAASEEGPSVEEATSFEDGKVSKKTSRVYILILISQLSCVDVDLTEIPSSLVEKYGADTRRLNLSFNALTSLRNLEGFANLEELNLSNNNLGLVL